MSYNGNTIIDADGHLMAGWSFIETHIDEPFRQRASDLIVHSRDKPGGLFALINELHDNRPWYPRRRILGAAEPWETAPDIVASSAGAHEKARPGAGRDPHNSILDLDDLGIDIFVGFAGNVTGLTGIPDAKFEAALIRAYNKWMRDFCKPYPRRLKGAAILPVGDIHEAVAEIERVAKEEWCVAIMTMATHGDFLPDHPRWYPVYAAAQKHELPICFHMHGSERPPYAPGRYDMADNPWMMHLLSHPWGIQRAMAAVVGGGIYDLFPKLRFAYLEAWSGWLPGFIDRLDGEASKPELKTSIPKLHRKPSEHLRDSRSFYSFDPDEKYFPFAVKQLGAERMIWASDYPHFDCPWDTMLTGVTECPELSERDKRLILGENALRLYPRIGAYATSHS